MAMVVVITCLKIIIDGGGSSSSKFDRPPKTGRPPFSSKLTMANHGKYGDGDVEFMGLPGYPLFSSIDGFSNLNHPAIGYPHLGHHPKFPSNSHRRPHHPTPRWWSSSSLRAAQIWELNEEPMKIITFWGDFHFWWGLHTGNKRAS